MCGIAAFSLAPGSKVNARALAHSLLAEIEDRGSHASGFAFSTDTGQVGVYKNNQPGSQLPLGLLPRNASTVILHTRYATQGSATDNNNNHPVFSPDRTIALVHNGVISNDAAMRATLGLTQAHGEVDSLVIPAIIAQRGVDALSKMAGYAAISWINFRDPHALEVMRLKNSPAAYTHLPDGSFVMASTVALLTKALYRADLDFGGVFDMADSSHITVRRGWIEQYQSAPRMSYDYASYNRNANATSGGKGATPTRSAATGRPSGFAPNKPNAASPISGKPALVTKPEEVEDDSCDAAQKNYSEALGVWKERRASQDTRDTERAMSLADDDEFWDKWNEAKGQEYGDEYVSFDDLTSEEQDAVVDKILADHPDLIPGDERNINYEVAPVASGGYYTLDNDGDINHYPTLDDLEGKLRWLGKMTPADSDPFPSAAKDEWWANYLADIGSVDDDGELISWVDDGAEIDEHESPAVRHLDYIRQGAGLMRRLKGA